MITPLLFSAVVASAAPPAAPAAPAPAAPASPAPVGTHVVTLPTAAGAGEPKEVKPVLDTAHLKVATITLRKGTVLAKHSAPMPVTILALSGKGAVVLEDGTRLRLEASQMVALAPNVPHAVEPDAGTDLVILVHHVKIAGAAAHGHGPPEGAPAHGKRAP